jgi:hypothetical protein
MSEGSWVPANIARDKLKTATGKEPEVLIAWASNGLLASRAQTWARDWRAPENNVDLPVTFWLGTPITREGIQLAEFRSGDWDSGIFRVIVKEAGASRYLEGQPPYHHTAHFVSFSVEDLKNCINQINGKPSRKVIEGNTRLSEAELKKWFDGLGFNSANLTQDELVVLCQKTYPNHSVSRDRIRLLTPNRKRGPKPNRR